MPTLPALALTEHAVGNLAFTYPVITSTLTLAQILGAVK